MSREKQIEEIAKELCDSTMCDLETFNNCRMPQGNCSRCQRVAKDLYNAGYRKQSENMVEITRCKDCQNCEEVPGILGKVLYCSEWCKDVDEDTFCSFGVKMKGGTEQQ